MVHYILLAKPAKERAADKKAKAPDSPARGQNKRRRGTAV